jgi:hypothetical protein
VSPAVLPSTLLALFAAASLVFGSALPTLPALRTRFFADRLSLLIGFSAGLMLAMALHELIPEALEKNPQQAMWGVGAGFLTLYIAERLTHFHACRHRECDVEDDAEAQAVDELTQLAAAPRVLIICICTARIRTQNIRMMRRATTHTKADPVSIRPALTRMALIHTAMPIRWRWPA